MNRFRHRIGVVALILLVVAAFVALGAGAAQASEWKIKGLTFKELALEKEEVSGSSEETVGFEVPESKLMVSCTSQVLKGTIVKGGTGQVSLELSKCLVTDLEKKSIAGCKVATPVLLKLTTGLVGTGAGAVYDEFLAEKEKTFATIGLGEECAPAEVLTLTGSASGLGSQTQKVSQSFSFSKKAAEDTGSSLASGKQTAYMFGTIIMKLAGKHSGEEWCPQEEWLDASPKEPKFGNVKVGTTSEIEVTFKYLGALPSSKIATFVQNGSKNNFAKGSDTCEGRIFLLNAETCIVWVKFSPTEVNTLKGTLTLEEQTAPFRKLSVTLEGVGI
jgi:hypothetical protein